MQGLVNEINSNLKYVNIWLDMDGLKKTMLTQVLYQHRIPTAQENAV